MTELNPDFVNRYIEKMKVLVSDLTMRNLILETDISFKIDYIAGLEKRITDLTEEASNKISQLVKELEEANKKYLDLEEQIKRSVTKKKITKKVDTVVKDNNVDLSDPLSDPKDGGYY